MPVLYSKLGMDKRLRDIVFAGSHDAAITSGGYNVQTQGVNIYGQALAGVRLFDLRIMAHNTGHGRAELKAYHAGGGVQKATKTKVMVETGKTETIVRSKLPIGDWGLGLQQILQDSKKFIVENPSEFLILKFDKCTNWDLIAQYCQKFLGNTIYTGKNGINRRRLRDLAGKVIVVFSDTGVSATDINRRDGIHGFRSLYDKKTPPKPYEPNYDGLQYFGKGGTSTNPRKMKKTKKGKIKSNITIQTGIISQMANSVTPNSSNVLGMMYWTSTGIFETIEKRNNKMWVGSGPDSLRNLWTSGLKESIEARTEANRIKTTNYSSGTYLKAFMPNIVMIDFADATKCKTIYKLNELAATQLTAMFQSDEEEESD